MVTKKKQPVIKLGKDIGVRKFATKEQEKRVKELEAKKEPEKRKKKKKFDIKEFRERPTLAGKAVKALTSLKTTAVLGATLAGVAGAGAAAGALGARAGTATITRTGTFGLGRKAVSLTTQRAFIGKSAASGINKIFHKVRPIATRYATNKKTVGLTTSFFKKATKIATSRSTLIAVIGSYPFAGFIREEALQTLGFAFNTAERNNDVEGMQAAVEEQEDILQAAPSILSNVPFANILIQLKAFFEAAQVKLNNDKRILEQKRAEQAGEETAFGAERRRTDEEARQRQLESRARDAEYFNLIREGKFEEAQELLDEELKGGE